MIDIIKIVNEYSVAERLMLIEQLLKTIREESVKENSFVDLSEFTGIIDDDEATSMKDAVNDARKIDLDGW
ncbi:MAG: hypothetical protein AAFP77_15235 [Bacteroidota bacterium]